MSRNCAQFRLVLDVHLHSQQMGTRKQEKEAVATCPPQRQISLPRVTYDPMGERRIRCTSTQANSLMPPKTPSHAASMRLFTWTGWRDDDVRHPKGRLSFSSGKAKILRRIPLVTNAFANLGGMLVVLGYQTSGSRTAARTEYL